MEAKDRIIVALDVDRPIKAEMLAEQLVEHVGGFKIGLGFITSGEAVPLVGFIHELNPDCKIFYDAKFNDIPSTVARAAHAAANLRVWAMSIHAPTGSDALKAAVDRRGKALVLAVTILTSLSDIDVVHNFGQRRIHKVLEFAWMAEQAGCDGVICSPHELAHINKYHNPQSLLKVVPGIRPLWANKDDQERSATPAETIRMGADYLVIGRPITQPPANIGTSFEAVKRITEEIEEQLAHKA